MHIFRDSLRVQIADRMLRVLKKDEIQLIVAVVTMLENAQEAILARQSLWKLRIIFIKQVDYLLQACLQAIYGEGRVFRDFGLVEHTDTRTIVFYFNQQKQGVGIILIYTHNALIINWLRNCLLQRWTGEFMRKEVGLQVWVIVFFCIYEVDKNDSSGLRCATFNKERSDLIYQVQDNHVRNELIKFNPVMPFQVALFCTEIRALFLSIILELPPLLRHQNGTMLDLLLCFVLVLVPDFRPSLQYRLPDSYKQSLIGVKWTELFGRFIHLYNYRILLQTIICQCGSARKISFGKSLFQTEKKIH